MRILRVTWFTLKAMTIFLGSVYLQIAAMNYIESKYGAKWVFITFGILLVIVVAASFFSYGWRTGIGKPKEDEAQQ
jgi:hypothetical protein